mgnify:CR=1 FL=1
MTSQTLRFLLPIALVTLIRVNALRGRRRHSTNDLYADLVSFDLVFIVNTHRNELIALPQLNCPADDRLAIQRYAQSALKMQ